MSIPMPLDVAPLRLGSAAERPASLEECEARILRAFATARADRVQGPAGYRSSIPAYVHSDADRRAQAEIAPKRGPLRWAPTPRDVSDCATALGWLAGIDGTDRDVVEYRALLIDRGRAPSWRSIGRDLGISQPAAQRGCAARIRSCDRGGVEVAAPEIKPLRIAPMIAC